MIKVWTNENCVQCDRTKKFLDENNIPYLTLSLAENPEDTKRFIEMGFQSAPIVETPHETWYGFRLERLKALTMEVNQ